MRVLIIDDHPLLRQAVSGILEAQPDFIVCGEADDLDDGLQVIEETRPDVVILDLCLKSGEGTEGVRAIRQRFPETKILVFSGLDQSVYASRVIRAGALGYVSKEEPIQSLLAGLRRVQTGEVYLSHELGSQFLKHLVTGEPAPAASPVELLSNRELEVFTLYGRGLRSREVAEHLNVSIKTIDAHRSRIKKKLNLKSAVEVTHRAIQWMQQGKT